MIQKHEDSFWGGILKTLGLVFGCDDKSGSGREKGSSR
jgi:hypothetical protein